MNTAVTTFPQQSVNGGFGMIAFIAAMLALLTLLTTLTTTAPPPSSQKMVAIVDDDDTWARISETVVSSAIDALGGGIPIQRYTNGEQLLAEMQVGKRFRLYILDNRLDERHLILWGPEITQRIRAIQPEAVIIGLSGDQDPGFITNGAKVFYKKTQVDVQEMINLTKSILQ